MQKKWWILIAFVVLYSIGIAGAAWHTYDATDSSKSVPTVEALKIVFIMLGGLGVLVPTYLNIWQSPENTNLLEDKARRDKIENTFRLIEKWDDKTLLEARKYSRAMKDQQDKLSPDQIKSKIAESAELRQSVILLFNYFEQVRISIEHDRIDPKIIKETLGMAFRDIYDRFKP